MIVFDLSCRQCGYLFEGWFHDQQEYALQQSEGLLRCPQCGDHRVRKLLSPVATLGRQRRDSVPSTVRTGADDMASQLRTCLTELKTSSVVISRMSE